MEEKALLHSRHSVDILNSNPFADDAVHLLLSQPRQREVGWRVSARMLATAVLNDFPQAAHILLSSFLNAFTPGHVGVVRPTDLQLAIGHHTAHIDNMLAAVLWRYRPAAAFLRRTEQLGFAEHLVKLPQIVEADFGLRKFRQVAADGFVFSYITQHSIAKSAIGHLAQLFLGLFKGLSNFPAFIYFKQHRVNSGEPAYGL